MTTHPQAGQKKKRGLKLPARKKKNPTGEMTLVEHLKELRYRLILAVVAVLCGTIVGFIWYQTAPPGIPPLGEMLRGPYCSLPDNLRADFTGDGECRLLATSPFEMLLLRLKIAGLAGLVLSSPFWLYQVWAFITPGLLRKERKFTFSFVSVAVLLFVLGAVLAYAVVSIGLEFLVSVGDQYQAAGLTGKEYFSFLLGFLVIFGVSFEVPLVVVTLNLLGLLRYDAIKDKRRIIIVAITIFAAVATPGQDPFTMIILSLALIILVELSFQFCRIHDKRRGRERPEWLGLDDEEASALDTAPGGMDAPQPVTSQPVAKPAPVRHDTAGATPFDDVL